MSIFIIITIFACFILNSMLFDINIVTPAFLCLLFEYYIFPLFYSQVICVFKSKVYILKATYIRLTFFLQSNKLCIWLSLVSSHLMLLLIQLDLTSFIFLLVFYVLSSWSISLSACFFINWMISSITYSINDFFTHFVVPLFWQLFL